MEKSKLKEYLLSLEEETIKEVQMNYEDYLMAGNVDTSFSTDLDEQAQHHESADMAERLDHQISEHVHHLEKLKKINFNPASTVRVGAIVKVNGRYIFVGIPKSKFQFDGKTFIGISTDAPLYQCIEGKKEGDTCQFNNVEFKIEEII